MPWDQPMVHWTQQVLKKLTRARSLVRESHRLLARNDKAELSAELRQIECALVMVLEDNRLIPSPPSARLAPSPPPTGLRCGNRRNRGRFTRGPPNRNSNPQPVGESQTPNCASTARNIQIVRAQSISSQTCRGTSTPTFTEDKTKITKPAKSTTIPPSQGVLVDFDEDSTVVELLPGIVAAMEALEIVHSEPKGQLEMC
ncbi:hypothetical protein N7537_000954 [Penicillium hordei]|uniref:Uncharacterized protein n=1 Tax=Penicillium hordei TaxID=40994 RepID=A0AAD6H7U1_9EURO|nr:uncharacterized protein N7537_000954 [Penicillium hordei]KAJ5615840.1 hypothetical protein N7537_000954 [Penicillium hordei]